MGNEIMFTWKEEQMNKPVRIWLENIEEVEEGCLEQARHLAQLPFIHKWVCLMPDTHQGKGMPIAESSLRTASSFQMQWASISAAE